MPFKLAFTTIGKVLSTTQVPAAFDLDMPWAGMTGWMNEQLESLIPDDGMPTHEYLGPSELAEFGLALSSPEEASAEMPPALEDVARTDAVIGDADAARVPVSAIDAVHPSSVPEVAQGHIDSRLATDASGTEKRESLAEMLGFKVLTSNRPTFTPPKPSAWRTKRSEKKSEG